MLPPRPCPLPRAPVRAAAPDLSLAPSKKLQAEYADYGKLRQDKGAWLYRQAFNDTTYANVTRPWLFALTNREQQRLWSVGRAARHLGH